MARAWFMAIVWLCCSLGSHFVAGEEKAEARSVMPRYRVDTEGFEAAEADIRAVCDSAGSTLWRYFPEHTIEPFVVVRGRRGPITLFRRNEQREIVLQLDTGKTFWSQYAYQFSHEFGHILCGFREGDVSNRWFEETLCETASLFALRAMAREWKEHAPYPNWANYRDSLRTYADDVVRSRAEELRSLYERGLPGYYRHHEATLRKDPIRRDLNGAMSVVLLGEFEATPETWQSVQWLNHTPIPKDESFAEYLLRWHRAAPERHQAAIARLAQMYGVKLVGP